MSALRNVSDLEAFKAARNATALSPPGRYRPPYVEMDNHQHHQVEVKDPIAYDVMEVMSSFIGKHDHISTKTVARNTASEWLRYLSKIETFGEAQAAAGRYNDKRETERNEEVANMADWREQYIFEKLDKDISEIKAYSRATEEKVSQMISQMLNELRDRDNQRHTELLELRKETNASLESIRSELRENLKWTIGTLVGIVAIIVTMLLR